MPSPTDRRYSDTHEWFKAQGAIVTVGLSRHAADELTDITYVDLPKAGEAVARGQAFGEIESVKATNELYSAVDGQVMRSNAALTTDPGLVNTDPYGAGWLIMVETQGADLSALMTAEEYDAKYG